MREVDELAHMNKRLAHRLTRMKEAMQAVLKSGTMRPGDFEAGHVRVDMRAFFLLWNAVDLDNQEAVTHPFGRDADPEREEGTD